MRLILSLILSICSFFPIVFAADAKIKTLILQGKPAYFLYISNLPSEAIAAAKKRALSTELKATPVQIQVENNQSYTLKIGPIRDYEKAKQLMGKSKSDVPAITQAEQVPDKPRRAQSAIRSEIAPSPTDKKKLWNLANADIRAVISEVSRLTGKNFIVDPRVQGKVSIISSTPLSNQALYQVFLSVIQVSGYTAVPSGKVIRIVPSMEARTSAPDQLSMLRTPPRGSEIMTSVVPVNYVPADQLVPVLRPLMPQWSYVSAYAPSNALILSGTADNIRQLTNIINQVDSSALNDIDVIEVHNTLAMDIANTLKDLIKPSNSAGSSQSVPTLAIDDKNNAIIISGNKTDRLRLRLLILKLDKKIASSTSSRTQVVYLHYSRAEDMVPILAGVAKANFSGSVGTTIGTVTRPAIDSTNPLSGLASDNPYSAPSQQVGTIPENPSNPKGDTDNKGTLKTTENEGSTKPTVQIIAEPNTNSIIMNGPSTIIRIMKQVITQLDIKPAQLLVEAMVAEIDESQLINLGIEWGTLGQTGNTEAFQPGFAIISSRTSINDFQSQVTALQKDRKANILSTPSVVVLDNRQAKILVGKQVSVASTTYPNNAGGTTVSGSPYTTINRVNAALHLYVRPQITEGNGIQLQIDQGNETIDPLATALAGELNPTFKISSIVTAVHVQSGDIIVLGGLIENTLSNDGVSIPILKDIPGIGRLFQRNSRNTERRLLMVFIRPIILHNENDTVFVSGQKYNMTRDVERAIMRAQEKFVQSDTDTIMKPINQSELPLPFTPPPRTASK